MKFFEILGMTFTQDHLDSLSETWGWTNNIISQDPKITAKGICDVTNCPKFNVTTISYLEMQEIFRGFR